MMQQFIRTLEVFKKYIQIFGRFNQQFSCKNWYNLLLLLTLLPLKTLYIFTAIKFENLFMSQSIWYSNKNGFLATWNWLEQTSNHPKILITKHFANGFIIDQDFYLDGQNKNKIVDCDFNSKSEENSFKKYCF